MLEFLCSFSCSWKDNDYKRLASLIEISFDYGKRIVSDFFLFFTPVNLHPYDIREKNARNCVIASRNCGVAGIR